MRTYLHLSIWNKISENIARFINNHPCRVFHESTKRTSCTCHYLTGPAFIPKNFCNVNCLRVSTVLLDKVPRGQRFVAHCRSVQPSCISLHLAMGISCDFLRIFNQIYRYSYRTHSTGNKISIASRIGEIFEDANDGDFCPPAQLRFFLYVDTSAILETEVYWNVPYGWMNFITFCTTFFKFPLYCFEVWRSG